MKERFPSADMLGQLAIALGKMDWDANDELRVKQKHEYTGPNAD